MLTILKRTAKKLFVTVLLAGCFSAGTILTYATIRYINVEADGSFFGISCGSSAGPTAIYFDAPTGHTYVLGPAQPGQRQ